MLGKGQSLPKSEATRLRLLDCAVEEIVESGPDRVGFTAIARRAGMSTGALYARYENADELLVDVWLQKCLPEVRNLVATVADAASGDGGLAILAIAERVNALDPVLLVTARLLVAARRNDTLWEVVDPSFRETVDRASATLPGLPFALAHVFGYVIGASGSGLDHLDWVGPLSLACRAAACATPVRVDMKKVSALAETPSEPMGDDVDNRLFVALSDVIGKVGVDRATVSRIARRAEVNPATIYMRYQDKDALVQRVVGIIAEMGVSRNQPLVENLGSEESLLGGIAMFRGNATEGYTAVRRLRLETMMSSGYHDDLRVVVRRIYVEAAGQDAAMFGVEGIVSDPVLLAFALFMRFTFFGHALLLEYGYMAPDDPCTESVLNDLFGQFGSAVGKFLSSGPGAKK